MIFQTLMKRLNLQRNFSKEMKIIKQTMLLHLVKSLILQMFRNQKLWPRTLQLERVLLKISSPFQKSKKNQLTQDRQKRRSIHLLRLPCTIHQLLRSKRQVSELLRIQLSSTSLLPTLMQLTNKKNRLGDRISLKLKT